MPTKHSIQRRVNAWVLASTALLLLTVGVLLAAGLSQQLIAEYDRTLLTQAQALIALTDQDLEGIEFEDDDAAPVFQPGAEAEYFQLWLTDDLTNPQPLARSPSLQEADLPYRPLAESVSRFHDLQLPDGRLGRQVQISFLVTLDEPDEEDGEDETMYASLQRQSAAVVVARERETLDGQLTRLSLILLTVGVVVMVLLVLLVRFAVGRGLRPLDDLRRQAERMDADSLGVPLQPSKPTVELDPMIEQFNALLARLETAFERERRFSADVAHELRTPLAELRNLADIGGRWPDDRPLVESFFHDVRDATTQMQRVVDNLLALARSERGLDVIDAAPFDLVAVLNLVWRQVSRDADARSLRLRYNGPPRLYVSGGRDQWVLILTNLLNNAASHSSGNSAIIVTVSADSTDAADPARPGTLHLSIANRTEQLTRADLPQLFDRLWRKDAARTDSRHAGLGLALVNAYARQLGLRVKPRLDDQAWFTMLLDGPVAAPPSAAAIAPDDSDYDTAPILS